MSSDEEDKIPSAQKEQQLSRRRRPKKERKKKLETKRGRTRFTIPYRLLPLWNQICGHENPCILFSVTEALTAAGIPLMWWNIMKKWLRQQYKIDTEWLQFLHKYLGPGNCISPNRAEDLARKTKLVSEFARQFMKAHPGVFQPFTVDLTHSPERETHSPERKRKPRYNNSTLTCY